VTVRLPRILALLSSTALLSACLIGRARPIEKVPQISARDRLVAEVASLPADLPFYYGGLAFLGGSLFATSNVGLLEFKSTSLQGLYRWNGPKWASQVEGPWIDRENGRLWIEHVIDWSLSMRDATGWNLDPGPEPSREYTRMNVLEGLRAADAPGHFWLIGGGHVFAWRPSEPRRWLEEAPPPHLPEFSEVWALAPVPTGLIYVVREGSAALLGDSPYAAYRKQDERWVRVLIGQLTTPTVVVSGAAVFLRSETRAVWRLADDRPSRMELPGPCEALAASANGRIFASVHGQGIYEFHDGAWMRRFRWPHAVGEGEHTAILAARDDGAVAYATNSTPHLTTMNDKETWSRSGTIALWISRGDALERVFP
jgi:hypothetical protein